MIMELVLAATILAGVPHHAPPMAPDTVVTETAISAPKKTDQETPVVTRHASIIDGREVGYTATAGVLPVLNDSGEPEAHLFYVAYRADGTKTPNKRPLFIFLNGGPGAASVWLHVGAAGPRRVKMLADGRLPPSPYRLVNNDSSWLDLGDLLFIDPVGTGYSRAVKADLVPKFATQQGDLDSLIRFIRLYLTRNERWSSPLFLVGESYGGFRSAGLTEGLLDRGIALNGVLFISPVLNFQTISFDNGNDLPYALFLPSYTATAWYHNKLSPELQSDLEKSLMLVEEWAATEYLTALARGDRLSTAERTALSAKLASFTGLNRTFIENRNLRIDSRSFVRELLQDRRQVVGYLDSRFIADNQDPSSFHGFDPTVAAIRPPYTATFNDYVRTELGYKSDLEYFTLGGGIGRWEYDAKNSYADTSDNLRSSLSKNPFMNVFVASGLFDLATPHMAADYTLNHLGLPGTLHATVTVRRYRAGHMMYLDEVSLGTLKKDVGEFIARSLDQKVAPEHSQQNCSGGKQ
jgi:carboxypeptidase C (cathepsin A)